MIDFTNKKVLIIRFSSLGDIILTTPLIRSLKNQYPNITLHYLVKENYHSALQFSPYLDKILLFNNSLTISNLRSLIKNEKYDYIIDLHASLRSILITLLLGIKVYRVKKPRIKKFLLVKFKYNLLKNYDLIPELYAKAIPGFALDELGPDLFLDSKTELINKINEKENIIGICPGAKHKTKSWGEKNYFELIRFLNKLNYKVYLFGGRSDKELCQRLSKIRNNVVDLSTDDELLLMAKDMLKCKLILGNDSGLMHVAAALKLPVIVIFTSTVREFGFEPYKAKSIIIENNEISCRPCSHVGLDECPKEHFNCANSISAADVFLKIKNMLKEL